MYSDELHIDVCNKSQALLLSAKCAEYKHKKCIYINLYLRTWLFVRYRGQPKFGVSFDFGAETRHISSFSPHSVSAEFK